MLVLIRKLFSAIIEEIKTVVFGLGLTLWELIKRSYHYSGFAHVCRKFIIVNDDKKYPTGFLWAVGLYFAIHQVAVLNYQGSVAPLNQKVDQISVGVDQGDLNYWLNLLPKVQRAKTFIKPEIWNPVLTINSLLGTESTNPDIIQGLIEVVESLGGSSKLQGSYLAVTNLVGVNFTGANLTGVYLKYADLERANLSGANLTEANLESTILERANLIGVNLTGANLVGAYLKEANLKGNLIIQEGDNPKGVYVFKKAKLEGVDLEMADLEKANLIGVNLEGVKNLTCKQIQSAKIDRETKFPNYITVTWADDDTYTCVMMEKEESDK